MSADANQPERGIVLVVDDEPGMRLALREVLQRNGWRVVLAEDAERALELIAEGLAPAIALTDFRMPGATGLELMRQARRRHAGPAWIMMTAYGTIEDAVAAMREGAADYLLKPFSMQAVLEVVERVASAAAGETSAPTEVLAKVNVPRRTGVTNDPIAESAALRRLLEVARMVAPADATVLLTGESGTGKEIVARAIHVASARRGPFVAVNCAALPEGLLESELFGHEKGAFTGAVLARKGRFEQAAGGTLLLDEISEMPPPLQAKLLRVLQEKEVSPVGSADTLRLDVRVVATTNRDLESMVAAGTFRQDLYYRLNVIALKIPALRERREDVLPLAEHFLRRYQRADRPRHRFADEVRRYMLAHPWPGNVRELENMVERACLLAHDAEIGVADLHPEGLGCAGAAVAADGAAAAPPFAFEEPMTIEEMERRLILATLARTGGNRTRTADALGVSVRTIRNKLNEYQIKEPAAR